MKEVISIIILCAVKNEYRAVKSIFEECYRTGVIKSTCCHYTIGRINSYKSLAACIGVGEKNVKKCFTSLLEEFDPCLVIIFGAAGAVNPNIHSGTVTMPLSVVNYRLPGILLDSLNIGNFSKQFEDIFVCANVKMTVAGTSSDFISSNKLKRSIYEMLHIDTTDCETFHIARICNDRHIPFFTLRCITDHAGFLAIVHYFLNASKILLNSVKLLKDIISQINNGQYNQDILGGVYERTGYD